MDDFKNFVPAEIHNCVSSLIFCKRRWFGVPIYSKILTFLFFQTSQHTNIMRDLSPCLATQMVWSRADHRSATESLAAQASGWRIISPSQHAISTQMRLVNLQSLKRWMPDSGRRWQKGQTCVFGHPRACSLSDVQILLRIVSLLKNLHFGGAQTFRTRTLKLVDVDPKNWAR